jgi:hypothetical protein
MQNDNEEDNRGYRMMVSVSIGAAIFYGVIGLYLLLT